MIVNKNCRHGRTEAAAVNAARPTARWTMNDVSNIVTARLVRFTRNAINRITRQIHRPGPWPSSCCVRPNPSPSRSRPDQSTPTGRLADMASGKSISGCAGMRSGAGHSLLTRNDGTRRNNTTWVQQLLKQNVRRPGMFVFILPDYYCRFPLR